MKLPKKIKVLGQTWKIIVKSLPKEEADSFGLCVPSERAIYINAEVKPCQLAATLLHEFVHAVFFVSGASYMLDERVEEMICDVLASAIEPLLYRGCVYESE